MTAEDIRNALNFLVDEICVEPLAGDEALTLGEIRDFAEQYQGRVRCACSEGCQGVTPIGGAPGFVIDLESGRRFHVTVRELPA